MANVTFTGKPRRATLDDLTNELDNVQTFILQLLDEVVAVRRLLERRVDTEAAIDAS